MAQTSLKQRIIYAIVLVVMVGGTLGAFLLTAYQLENPDQQELQQRQAMAEFNAKIQKYQEDMVAWQEKIATKYSAIYYDEFKQYEQSPYAFNAESVKELETKDLKLGEGEELAEDTKYQAYYIGWLPSGEVFDSSFADGKLKAPIEGGNLIEGWNKGVLGMKVGGVRELTIPSDLAYGETGSGKIPGNSPIKFVVMIIPALSEEDNSSRPVYE